MRVIKTLFLLLLAANVPPLSAGEHRQHGAHEHGVGRLDVALEDASLEIGLDSPAVNIVGFEHAPDNGEDREKLDKALARLRQGAELFVTPEAAGCRLVDSDIQTPLVDHGEPSGQPVEHEDEHAGHEHGETHADIVAAWRFSCEHPASLTRLDVQMFEVFPLTERLQVQFITASRQGGAELSRENHVLRF